MPLQPPKPCPPLQVPVRRPPTSFLLGDPAAIKEAKERGD